MDKVIEHLIAGCRRRDRNAQLGLYERYVRALYATCLRIVVDPREAAEAMQDAFLKIFTHIEEYSGEASDAFEAWMRQIAVRTAIDHVRREEPEWEELPANWAIADEEEPVYECEALPSPDPEVESLGMTGVISRIIDERIETPALTEAEEALQGALLDKVSRRRFLTLLLTLPDTETPGFIGGVARVMSVDRGLIYRFYTLRHDELEVSYEERVKAEDVAGRYWKALMLLRHAIAKETDMEKIEDLEKAYRRTKGIYARRRMIAAKSRKGMSQKAVSKLLNKPRSTISNDICCMRQLLKSIEPMVKI